MNRYLFATVFIVSSLSAASSTKVITKTVTTTKSTTKIPRWKQRQLSLKNRESSKSTATSNRPRGPEAVRQRKEKKLAAQIKKQLPQTAKAYAPILEAYKLVKKAQPAEFSFFVDKLKSTIIKEVENGNLDNFLPSRWWNRVANGLSIASGVINCVSAAKGYYRSPNQSIRDYESRQSIYAMNRRQQVLDSTPLLNFFEVILPRTIAPFKAYLQVASENPFSKEVKLFVEKLEDINRIFA